MSAAAIIEIRPLNPPAPQGCPRDDAEQIWPNSAEQALNEKHINDGTAWFPTLPA
jgi:hypothetical protein